MKHHLLKRIFCVLLVAVMLAGYVPHVQAAPILTWKESDKATSPDLTDRLVEKAAGEDAYKPTDIVRVSIVLEEKSTIQAGFPTLNIARNEAAMAYNRRLQDSQSSLEKKISTQALNGQKLDVVWNLTLVGNLISANVPYGRIAAIEKVAGVREVVIENIYAPCVVSRDNVAQPQMYASIGMSGSGLVWSSGYTGAGSRIAVIDTGTDTDHQSLDCGAFLYSLEQNAKADGMDYDLYLDSLDLLDEQEIASVLTKLNIYKRDSSLTAAKLYLNEKLPFAVNYVDGGSSRLVVDHESDYQGEHGSHVAGIATANRYIPSGSGYVDALDAVNMTGMAPDAQLITMKVFGTNPGPSDSDYMAAIEDAIYLGCDAVNLSLGSSMAGDSYNPYFSELLEYMTKTDTVVVASAGNSGTWADATSFSYLYSDDVSLDTVGAPGSYSNLLAVASVNNDGGVGTAFRVDGQSYMYVDTDGNNTHYPMVSLDKTSDASGTEYEYVFIDGLGYEEDYAGIDCTGKVVFVSRGDLNFANKANIAVEQGAIAVVIYNNEAGFINMDMSGYRYVEPCVLIAQASANAIRSVSTRQTTDAGLTYYTGKMEILGREIGIMQNSEYYTMSSFSSWGVPGDLSIKPEITAPGGQIYSLYGKTPEGGGYNQYEVMSGTSMAAPAVTGMVALMAQYLRESGLAEQEDLSLRTLAQSLLMSTAVPMLDEGTQSFFSIMQQGSGLARADLAASAGSYILVDGQPDGKVKAELGDDPNRTGVYEFSFSLNNLTGAAQEYTFRADIFRQDIFEYLTDSNVWLMDTLTTDLPGVATFSVNGTQIGNKEDLSDYDLNGDGKTNAADADYLLEYLLGNESDLYGNADVNGDTIMNTYDAHVLLTLLSGTGTVTVPAKGSVTVDVKLELTANGKAMLDAACPNGSYVEAYVFAEEVTDEEGIAGTCHSIPVLGFYGSWTDPTMFERSNYVEMMYNDSTKAPYLYYTTGTSYNGLSIDYGDGEEYYFGGNPLLEDDYYQPERNAMNSQDASYLRHQYFTLIRGASDMRLVVANADTGEVYMQKSMDSHLPAYYHVNYGQWQNIKQDTYLGWSGTDASGMPLADGTNVAVSLIAAPEYYRNEDGTHDFDALGDGAYLTTTFTIDNTAPEILDWDLDEATLTVTAQDNRHVAAIALFNAGGNIALAYDNPNQSNINEAVSVDLDLTNLIGTTFLLAVYDYAMNETVWEVTLELPEVERPYFTVVDYSTGTYYGISADGDSIMLGSGTRGQIQAAEFVDGYVFEISEGNQLYVGSDSDLNNFHYVSTLDPDQEYGITYFLDLAYNYADGKLYGLFYCTRNREAAPYLCTIDMFTGEWDVLYEMPVDVNNMAIDDEGNFYSVTYNAPSLFTYTLDDLEEGILSYVGEIGYYGTGTLNSLAWDHNTDTLYWAYPGALLEVNPQTAQPKLLSYFDYQMTGLYICPETYGNRFAPTNQVSMVKLNYTEVQTLVDGVFSLSAQVYPWNVTDRSVTWSSSNTNVATVDQSGMVTGISEGTVTITAKSNLDPTKTASCTMTIVDLDTTLNAILCDENAETWWIEFQANDLDNRTILTDAPVESALATATIAPDGTVYAGTVDLSTGYLESDLYTVNPETFEMVRIGHSEYGYTDMAYSPNFYGKDNGVILATYGGRLLVIDPSSAQMQDYYELWGSNLVGIAYMGSEPYAYPEFNIDTYVDWFFLIDTDGYVYLTGFLTDIYGAPYYMDHSSTTGGIFTATNAVTDTAYYSAMHFDGEYIYYSRFSEESNKSTLYAIDTLSNRKAYQLGDFGENVWPVGGLIDLSTLAPRSSLLDMSVTAQPKKAEQTTEIAALAATVSKVSAPQKATGGLNAAVDVRFHDNSLDIRSIGQFQPDDGQVTVTLTPTTDTPNGRMTVSYDPAKLTLVSVTGATEAFAYTTGNGFVEIAFASQFILDENTTAATLVFDVVQPGTHSITVGHSEANNGDSVEFETLNVACGCAHSYATAIQDPTCTEEGYTLYYCIYCDHSYKDDFQDPLGHLYEGVVTEPTCQAGGYTTYTCAYCGDTYVDDHTDPVDHRYEDGSCVWCGEVEYLVKWRATDAILGGDISLNFYVQLSENIVNNPNAYVKFSFADRTYTVPMSEAVPSVKNGETRYRFTCKVTSKHMADTIYAQIMIGDEVIGKTFTKSVMQYADALLAISPTGKLANLVKAMLNYGAAAQIQFNHNTDNLANAILSKEDQVLQTVDPTPYARVKTGKEDGIKIASSTLLLDSETVVRVVYKLTGDKTIDEYTFLVNGQEVTPIEDNGRYYVEVRGIGAHRLGEYQVFTVGGLTMKYCALSYVDMVYEYYPDNQTLVNTANALYAYAMAAAAYTS